MHPDSQYWFAFTYLKKRYTFTRLPQGYSESPTIYSQMMQNNMSKFTPPRGSQILLYVDDILIASKTKQDCVTDTVALLKFLASQGHKASKNKIQLCKESVVYLGHSLSAGGRTILETRKTAVLQAPKPTTKKQMMSFLGLTNYCRNWIPDYAAITQPLSQLMYDNPLKMSDKLEWTKEAEKAFCVIKSALVSSTTLALPNYTKVFYQTVDCKGKFMTSVLTQKHGEKQRPVAYYSSRLDSVAAALPPCVRAVVAASMAVEASSTVVLFHPLHLMVPHAVSVLLLQTKMTFLSPARHLSCMATLLSQPHLTITRCNTLNPSTLLPTEEEGEPHDCQAETEKVYKPRPDLSDQPLKRGEIIFVDGSARKDERGKNQVGYAVVTQTEIFEAEPLPSHYSAQAAELVALTRACELMKGKDVTIYTDSQYAYSTLHTFAQHWKHRGMVTSTGKMVTHAELLTKLLGAILLPRTVAVVKCAAHTNKTDDVSKGNDFADKTAKEAAKRAIVDVSTLEEHSLNNDILKEMQEQSHGAEIKMWQTKGAKTDKNGIYR